MPRGVLQKSHSRGLAKFALALLALLGFATLAAAAPLDAVESRLFTARDFRLESGAVLPELAIAYETYGTLAPGGRNAMLATHGFSSSHHAAGRYRPGGAPPGHNDRDLGWWDKLIGPGKAIDTDRLFVVSSNMLGSSYGSTAPRSLNPATGKPYGPDFPAIKLADIVRAQRLLLDHLGVTHLVAVAGPSYGGFQAFQWAAQFPDMVDGIVPVVSSPRAAYGSAGTERMIAALAQDPNWNGGHYYERGGIHQAMTRYRSGMLKGYGIEAQLMGKFPDAAEREAEIVRRAQPWVQAFDGHSMIVLRRALEDFDTTPDFGRIRAKVLYVLSRTDTLFPPRGAPRHMQALAAAGVDARYVEIDSNNGHLASGQDGEKWAPDLKAFMAELMAKT